MELTDAQQERIVQRLSKPSGLTEGLASIAGEPIVLDGWQRDFADIEDQFVIWNKSRAAGWSFSAADRAWSRSYLSKPNSYFAILVSYNMSDAGEKMRYVDAFDESLPDEYRMKRKIDRSGPNAEIVYSNGNRILSAFSPRGKHKAEVFIDEMAHMSDARSIWNACLPITSRGGKVFVGSTPMGKTGMFHDIWIKAEGKFKEFKKISVPWWRSSALSVDVSTKAIYAARSMATAERVERYGTKSLQGIYGNMFEEDFSTEYECAWADESTAFLPWSLIEACSPTSSDGPVVRLAHPAVRTYSEALLAVESLRGRGELYSGADIGRRIDATEICVAERIGTSGRLEERVKITLEKCKFDKQEAVMRALCQLPNLKKLVIDRSGLGEQLAERLETEFRSKVVAQVISPKTKPEMANNLRMVFEKSLYQFYPDRDTRQQFHSVKKVITRAGNIIYDVDRNEKHHADKFWATALMLWGASDSVRGQKPSIILLSDDDDDDRLPGSIFHNFG